ncbi:hypothetical protein RHMOL_Rhmol10G0046600 [Rhododendron molle]|uniref:Uncharacterized protein n=1 Tax=Rhododendron molle TaxID=49168 RepID=A0ACC0M0E9_RHOML|nr:hypothetical protein RHMOL_Rhmol10G0046600 [Rhododendron molle]
MDRHFNQAIVDKNPVVASAALVLRNSKYKQPGGGPSIVCLSSEFNILREEGGFDYKKAIVDSIVILIRDIPDAKESGLLHLCEFIEDCEFTYLSKQVRDRATLYLNMLGGEGAVVETEYAVNVVKDSFDSYVLFQYNCTNTIPEQLLGNVSVIVDASEAEEFAEGTTSGSRLVPGKVMSAAPVANECRILYCHSLGMYSY